MGKAKGHIIYEGPSLIDGKPIVVVATQQSNTQAWENAFAPIEHAFDSSIQGIMQGTQTLQSGIQKLAQSMVLLLTFYGLCRVCA